MSDRQLEETEEFVYRPSQESVESTNVWEFMQEYDIDEYDELIERTTTKVPGEPASGVEWFWNELVEYLGIEFYEEYAEVPGWNER